MTDKEKKQKTYSDLSVAERYSRIESLWKSLESTIEGSRTLNTEQFFITMHKVGKEIDMFIRHYFDGSEPTEVIQNIEILNKVNRIQLMIKVR